MQTLFHGFHRLGAVAPTRRLFLAALLLAPLAGLMAAEAPPPAADIDAKTPASAAKDGWELTFSDEFEGPQVDSNKWIIMDRKERLAKNVALSAGILRLVTGRHEKEWTSAWLSTKSFRQKYGWFECRFRIAGASGLNNAFWLNTPPERLALKDPNLARFEIDIVQAHYPHEVSMTLHNWKGKHTGSGQKHQADSELSKDFHVYALEWTPKELIWYFDGKKIRTLSHTICNAEEEVLLSTKVASFAGKTSSALDGKSMDVDYVRVYQKKE
ncbi:MAG: glycoside hydrolase family 16 protein [Kiritimatiellaeota bacterium]|nr:glycoside hydrolase family 16 protein [Kiritimatiellota bacterium]